MFKRKVSKVKIQNYEIHPKTELIEIIKNTTLNGDSSIKPFQNSDVFIQSVKTPQLYPTQKFVLQDQLNNINLLYKYFLTKGINIANIDGYIIYNTDESDNTYVLTPPIIEIIENQPLIIDGQHRTKFFGDKNIPFNAVCINNIPKEYYPYQLPNKGGWNDVACFDTQLPEGFVRKELRYPDKKTKKFMFREYPFPGIIKIAREHTGKNY